MSLTLFRVSGQLPPRRIATWIIPPSPRQVLSWMIFPLIIALQTIAPRAKLPPQIVAAQTTAPMENYLQIIAPWMIAPGHLPQR